MLPQRWNYKAWRLLPLLFLLAGCGVLSKPNVKPAPAAKDAPVVVLYEHPTAVIATHPWFVYSSDGKNWYLVEVRNVRSEATGNYVHVFHAYGEAPPAEWRRVPHGGSERRRWHGDLAASAIEALSKAPTEYPKRDKYRAEGGPNSNTFAQWVGDTTDLPGDLLGSDAIGKGYD